MQFLPKEKPNQRRLETEMEVDRTGKQEPEAKADMQFLPDSAEQIAESIKRTGLRAKLDEAFQAAIARAKGNQEERGGYGHT